MRVGFLVKMKIDYFSVSEEDWVGVIIDFKTLVDSFGEAVAEEQFDWLVDETEKWCKDKAIYNAILDGIHIIDGKSKDQTAEAIPSFLTDALSVSFDTHIGHDYMEQYEERYEF